MGSEYIYVPTIKIFDNFLKEYTVTLKTVRSAPLVYEIKLIKTLHGYLHMRKVSESILLYKFFLLKITFFRVY